jgi:hypothetical protein
MTVTVKWVCKGTGEDGGFLTNVRCFSVSKEGIHSRQAKDTKFVAWRIFSYGFCLNHAPSPNPPPPFFDTEEKET